MLYERSVYVNDEGNLASTEEEKRLAWKSHYEKLLNTEFDWNRDSLSEVHPVEGPAMQIKKEWVEEAIRKMKNGKGCRNVRYCYRNGESIRRYWN